MTDIGVCMTVRGERDLIFANIEHHFDAGVGQIYIFVDDLDPAYVRELNSIANVRAVYSDIDLCRKSGRVDPCFRRDYSASHIARQMVHLHCAAELAEQDGLGWLLNIDADEFVHSLKEDRPTGGLKRALESLAPEIDAVRFPTMEIVSEKLGHKPLAKPRSFKAPIHPGGEAGRARSSSMPCDDERLVKLLRLWALPDLMSTRRQLSQLGLPPQDVPMIRLLPEDTSDPVILDWYLGHAQGKYAVRLGKGLFFKNLLHPSSPRELDHVSDDYRIFHFNCYSPEKAVSKYIAFSQHPSSNSIGGSVDPVKAIMLRYSHAEDWERFHRFFEQVALYSPEKLASVQQGWPQAVHRVDDFVGLF